MLNLKNIFSYDNKYKLIALIIYKHIKFNIIIAINSYIINTENKSLLRKSFVQDFLSFAYLINNQKTLNNHHFDLKFIYF